MPFEPFPSNLRMGICQRLGLWSKIKIQPTSIRIWIAGRESDNQNHSFSLYLYIYIYIDAGASCKGNIQPNLGRKARPWQGPVHPSHLIPMAAMAICGRGMPECQGTIWSISIRTILSPPAVAADANAKHPDIPRHHWTLDCNQLHSTKIAWYERGSILVPMHFHKVVGKRVDIHEKSHGKIKFLSHPWVQVIHWKHRHLEMCSPMSDATHNSQMKVPQKHQQRTGSL